MDDTTIQNLLAQANAQASTTQIQQAQQENVTPEQQVEAVRQQADPTQVAQKEALTPEQQRQQALDVLAKYEKAQVNDNTGEIILDADKKEQVEEQKGEEEDISNLPLEEQIKVLQERLAKEKGEEPTEVNPLENVEKKVEEAGLKLEDYEQEYLEKGELSEESLKALKDAGFDKQAVDAYVETKTAQEEAKATAIINAVCESKENFDTMVSWMQENLTEAEINEYNKGVQTEHARIYLKDMYSRYSQNTSKARVIRGKDIRTTDNSQNTFNSEMDLVKAMADSRYNTDPVYRQQVRNKAMKMGQ